MQTWTGCTTRTCGHDASQKLWWRASGGAMPHIEECKPHCLKLRHAGSTASHGGMQAPMLDSSTLPCIGKHSQSCKHCFSQISKKIMQAENLLIHRCVTKQRPPPIAKVYMHDRLNICALESHCANQAPKTGLRNFSRLKDNKTAFLT